MKMPPNPANEPHQVKERRIQRFIRSAKGERSRKRKNPSADRVKRQFWLDQRDIYLLERERLQRLRSGATGSRSALVRDAIKLAYERHRSRSPGTQDTQAGWAEQPEHYDRSDQGTHVEQADGGEQSEG